MSKKLKDNPDFGMNSRFDKSLLPEHYQDIFQEKPNYLGDGNMSIDQLQKLCKQFEEYCHQQSIIKVELLHEINKYT